MFERPFRNHIASAHFRDENQKSQERLWPIVTSWLLAWQKLEWRGSDCTMLLFSLVPIPLCSFVCKFDCKWHSSFIRAGDDKEKKPCSYLFSSFLANLLLPFQKQNVKTAAQVHALEYRVAEKTRSCLHSGPAPLNGKVFSARRERWWWKWHHIKQWKRFLLQKLPFKLGVSRINMGLLL